MATATNKSYLVIGSDGAELKTVKTLAAAKKLADAEGGSVLVDGECVYRATVEATVNPTVEAGEDKKAAEAENAAVVEEKPAVEKYRIKTLMNIRKEPDLSGEKVGIAKQGAIVTVKEVAGDWLCLTDGTYILCGGGEFAEPAQ
jgi:hypothetical protein